MRAAAAALGLATALAGCQPQIPKGQVLAVVNGEEVTAQDVATERRNTPGGAQLSAPAALQKVIDRVLLAQAAHARKLDADPDYPADLARLRQDYLARRLVQAAVKAPPSPTPAQIAQAISTHPFQFADRNRLQVDQLNFQGVPAWTAVHDLADLPAVIARLNELGVPSERTSRTIDTAELPDDLAAKLAGQPIGKLLFIRQGDLFVALVQTGRSPVAVSPEDQRKLAVALIERESARKQTSALVADLTRTAKISYQPGYRPSAGTKASN